MASDEHLSVVARTDRKARTPILMRRAAGHRCRASSMPAEGFGNGFSGHGAPRPVRLGGRGGVIGGGGFSARDHSASTPKKPVTFCMIWRASSSVRSRPGAVARLAGSGRSACRRHCRLQRRDVSSKTSRAVPPLRAPGLRSRNPTDDAGPNRDLHLQASPSQGSPVVLTSGRFSVAPRSREW